MSLTPMAVDFYDADKKRLTDHLNKLEQMVSTLIDFVNFGVVKIMEKEISFHYWVCNNCGGRVRFNGGDSETAPKECCACHKSMGFLEIVDIFSDFAEPYFYSLLSKATMFSVGVKARELEWKESFIKEAPTAGEQASEEQPKQGGGLLSKIKNTLVGSAKPKPEESFETAIEEKTKTISQLYYEARTLIKYQGDPRMRERLSKIRKELTDTIPQLYSSTLRYVQEELTGVNVAVTRAMG